MSDDSQTVVGESVTFRNVTKSYGGKEVLHSFNLDIKAGEMVSLLGPSGCGKSTALRCLSGFESITRGEILIGDKSVAPVPPQKRGIGMVFQQYSLFPNMNVLDNVAFGLKVRKVGKDERIASARSILDMVGLKDFAEAYPARLSGGQQQRVALARAIVVNPKVLLLDEPLSCA
jgi:putative spermidine/putrescine transport system ATP-binding protein